MIVNVDEAPRIDERSTGVWPAPVRHIFLLPLVTTAGRGLDFGYQSPSTSGFNSDSLSAQHSARGCPRQLSSRKKLTPRSTSLTTASSTMVKRPTPDGTVRL